MKRIFCLLLTLVICLSAAATARADLIFEPDDSFFSDNWEECQYHNRYYFAQGPNGGVTVYGSPESPVEDARLENGQPLWISHIYTDAEGIEWGYTEQFNGAWAGWVPMDYLLLKYDHICFSEEFADRITEVTGELSTDGNVYFWNYPGSDDFVEVPVDGDYLPGYSKVFTDDAGREWGYVAYHMGIKNVWICLDAPTADYDTLYAAHSPQQVTHPVMPDIADAEEIKPAGPGLGGILAAAGAVAVLSGGFLWITRRKNEK